MNTRILRTALIDFLLIIALFAAFAIAHSAEPAKARHKFGWKEDSAGKVDKSIINRPHFSGTPIAASSDLRSLMPPVYDQGSLGSCVGNGVAAVLDYGHRLNHPAFFTPSRLFLYYCGRVIEGTVNEDSGLQIRDGVTAALKSGAPLEKTWPYNIGRYTVKPSATAYAEGLTHQALHAYKVDNTDGVSIRRALSLKLPVVFGAMVYSAIEDLDLFHTTLPIPKKGERSIGGHCLVVVGHDDKKQLYLVRNSWGTIWGRNGYAWFPYEYLHNGRITSDCWVIDVAE